MFAEYLKLKQQVINESLLLEKLIIINNSANYGQIVFLAGGAGSGKGFAIQKFLEGNKFKVRDVDEWKRLYIKLNDLNMDLRNPEDVRKLHAMVDQAQIKDKTLELLLKDNDTNTLPNIIFDITAKNIGTIYGTAETCLKTGYKPENIHIVWVLTSFDIAAAANKKRDRIVPEDILLNTHIGASKTMIEFIFKRLRKEFVNGSIYVILNNREETKFAPQSPNAASPTTTNIEDFSYIQVKKTGKGVELDDRMKDTVAKWIHDNSPLTNNYFKPKTFDANELRNNPMYIDQFDLAKGLSVIVTDSDPYDAMYYMMRNRIVTMEYVPNYKTRIKEIKKDVDYFISTIRQYIRR